MTSTARQNRIANNSDEPCFYIRVGHQPFTLTQNEMQSEPTSILVELKDIADSGRSPRLNADANVFRLIHTHLQGYENFPLPPQGVPCGAPTGFCAPPHLLSLNETQIRSEPQSIFVDLLEEGKWADLDVDANVFRLIHAHLKGYEIFPLPLHGIPYAAGLFPNSYAARILPYLSKEATLKNLLRDATDFGLMNLVAKIEREMASQAKAFKESKTQPADDENEASKEFTMLDSV